MRVIIIEDKDARALLDSLKLESLTVNQGWGGDPDSQSLVSAIHRAFHYRVCVWLQEQGCEVVRNG